ncbi:hypothetical protein ACRAWF_02880 [Streptomyces sp. L7]
MPVRTRAANSGAVRPRGPSPTRPWWWRPAGGVFDRTAEHLRLVRVGEGSARDLLHRLPPQPLGVDERSVHVEQDGLERELGVGGHVSLFQYGYCRGDYGPTG